jgi:transglutaminase-like putative cysteine protease
MRTRLFLAITLALIAVLCFAAPAVKPAERSFVFTYTAMVNNIPDGAKSVSMWVPYPVSDAHQVVSDVQFRSPLATRISKEPGYGNSALYMTVDNPKERSIPIEVSFKVTRKEYVRRDFEHPPAKAPEPAPARYLQPDTLVPLNDVVRKISADVTAGKKTDLDRARAIYDYVVANMKYDKTGTGWGNGDILWACDAKRGNCTDFHALFIGLCRAAGIPARFSIGFPLPEKRGEGEIPGYHCWAEFYLKGYGWVPVDASEAAKHPEKKEYFFGAHDENRVQLSTGRDIILSPKQSGGPLNYFVYPYVEVDGAPFKDVTRKFSFRDSDAAGGGSTPKS